MALEHTILVIAYHLIQRNEPYRELGGNYFDNRRPEATAKRLVKRLEQLGYSVSLEHTPAFCLGIGIFKTADLEIEEFLFECSPR